MVKDATGAILGAVIGVDGGGVVDVLIPIDGRTFYARVDRFGQFLDADMPWVYFETGDCTGPALAQVPSLDGAMTLEMVRTDPPSSALYYSADDRRTITLHSKGRPDGTGCQVDTTAMPVATLLGPIEFTAPFRVEVQ